MEVFDEIDILHDYDLYELIEYVNPERTYRIRPKTNHFDHWNDREFYDRFRLSKGTVTMLLNAIEEQLQHRTQWNLNRSVTSMNQVLLTLRFLATGDFYITMGDFGDVHKSTVGKIINRVLTAICNKCNNIKLATTEEEQLEISTNFYRLAHFPRVIGAIDCTHVKLQSPGGDNAETFRNRKGYFSLNVQAICDAKNKFLNLVCRWPGSTHDAHIFNNSAIKMQFENNEIGHFYLLGDSGYPLKEYLLTPIEHPQGEAETVYNESQIRTRNVIERTFGIWKRRFPILKGGIRTKLDTAQKIIVACAILHNIACEQNEEQFEGDDDVDIEDLQNSVQNSNDERGNNERLNVVNFFRNLLNNNIL